MRWLPPLTALRAFEAVGRFGVVRAASQLNVTPAAIYHQIRALEGDLGVTLFSRSKGKGLVLTLKGQDYLTKIAAIFDQLNESSRQIRGSTSPARLLIDSIASFATDFLVPRLPRFVNGNPGLQLEFITPSKGFAPVKFEKTGAHIAIRGGGAAGHWPGLHAEMIVHETMFPVCSPGYLRKAKLNEPADLAGHRLLDVPRVPEGWREWIDAATNAGHEMQEVRLDDALKFDLIHMSTEAALQGLGIELGRAPLVDRHLETGALVEPFKLRVKATLSYWMICQESFAKTELYGAFREWLLSEVRRSKFGADDMPLAAVS